MAWKNYSINSYVCSVGGEYYYGQVKLYGDGFYALLRFYKNDSLPNATAEFEGGAQRFYGHLDFQQMPVMIDLLRNEDGLRFYFSENDPNHFHLMTGSESVGEGE